jgi:hypothetical protein
MALSDPWPDLRHVRYVLLSPYVPGTAPPDLTLGARMLRNGVVGASVAGTLGIHAGHALAGLLVGGVVGTASALLAAWRPPHIERGFAMVPWGLLVDGPHEVTAVRWSGVHDLDVRYRATRDGIVRTRVAIDSVVGSLVGWASDAVDVGALAGNLDLFAAASSRPLATDLGGEDGARDGEPFVERVLDAARKLVDFEGDRVFGLAPASYRDRHGPASDPARIAERLKTMGESAAGAADPWGLVAAIAGELRLSSFSSQLGRLANAPHPGVAAIARAAIARLKRGEDHEADDEIDALTWFVPPDELSRLRAWATT